MKQLNVVLGDFSHTTKLMANNFVPLNISLVASFSRKKFGANVAIHLFKDVKKMQQFIAHNAVEVLGLSHYIWNSSLSLYLIRQYKLSNPNGTTVLGGPHFFKEDKLILSWLLKHPYVDFVIDSEGEVAFSNILDKLISCGHNIKKCKETAAPGCYFLQGDNFVYAPEKYLVNLDEIPSPYLAGLLDQFLLENIDGYELYPLFEHTRGCPFQCTFCRNSIENKKMRAFSTERLINEIKYVANFVEQHSLYRPVIMLADQNFGMYKSDYLIAKELKKIQDKFNFPQKVIITTGKGNYQNVLKTVNAFPSIKMSFSVQSLDGNVLAATKRKNFPLVLFQQYHNNARERDEHTSSEIIVGLPEDSKAKHLATINTLLTMGIDYIIPFSFMLLPGTPVESSIARKQYSYVTKYRLVPGGFSEINGSKIFETEEIVVSTSTLLFDDYVYLRRIHLLVMGGFNGSVFYELRRLLLETKIRFDIYLQNMNSFCESDGCPVRIADTLKEFSSKAKKELFESPEQLTTYYIERYPDLLNDRIGENLLQKYVYQLYTEVQDFAEVMISTFARLGGESRVKDCQDIIKVMRMKAICIKCLLRGEPPTLMNPIAFTSTIDITAWTADASKKIGDCILEHPVKFIAFYPEDLIQNSEMLH